MTKTLTSNEFWGRRSGALTFVPKDRIYILGFRQMQYGCGASGAGRKLNTDLKGLNKKWFHGYKNTHDVVVKAKGQK